MNRRHYWDRIREIEAVLPETVVLISQDPWGSGAAGKRVEAPRSVAARDLVMGTHRLASEAEAAEFHQLQAKQRDEMIQREAERRQPVVWMMPQPSGSTPHVATKKESK